MKRKLIYLYRQYKYIGYLLNKSRKIGLGLKIKMRFSGFFDSSYFLYDFKNNNLENYITDYQENVPLQFLNGSNQVLENKLYFSELVKNDVAISDVYGYVFNGRYYPSERKICDFMDLLNLKKDLFLKQIDGDGGIGIYKISIVGNNIYSNGSLITGEKIVELLKSLDCYMISGIVEQADYAQNLFPKTVNTIRFLTLVNPETMKPFIAAAAHRIGTKKSYPVDNCAKGGLTANINLENGVIGKATTTKELKWFTKHPDTKKQIEKVQIPGWTVLKSKILNIAGKFNYLPCVGWDVVIKNEHEFYILEGNNSPDLKLHQVHKPLLKNPQVVDFYKYHKIIN